MRRALRGLATDFLTGRSGRAAGFFLELVMEGGAQLRSNLSKPKGPAGGR
jgi:hypothetical protein